MDEAGGRPWSAGQRLGVLAIAGLLAALAYAFPLPGIPEEGRRLTAVLVVVATLWLSEALPLAVTALLGPALAVVVGAAAASRAFAEFGNPIVLLFIGSFLLAGATFKHRLNERIAYRILSHPLVGNDLIQAFALLGLTTAALSAWMSNVAVTAMMLPIALAVLRAIIGTRRDVPRALAAGFVLIVTYGASIGGLFTPVGTPPNLIGIGFLRREMGVDVAFFSWIALGVPVVVLTFAAMIARLLWSSSERQVHLAGVAQTIAEQRRALGPWTRGQVNTVIAFAVAVVLWITPGVMALVLGQDHPAYRAYTGALPEGVVALFAAGLLFVLPTNLRRLEFTLDWREAVQIDWWIVFLYGGGIALGTLAFTTGLAERLGFALTSLVGVESELGLIALSALIAAALSETTSNTASVNMIVPVVIAFARSSGIDPLLPALAATMAASLGFMLPVSTPCNAIVYASGRIPLTTMMRHGIWLDLAGVIVVTLVVGGLGPLLRGLLGG